MGILLRWTPAADNNALLLWQHLQKILDDNNRLTEKWGSSLDEQHFKFSLVRRRTIVGVGTGALEIGTGSGEGKDEGGESWGRCAKTWLVRHSVDSHETVFVNHHPG